MSKKPAPRKARVAATVEETPKAQPKERIITDAEKYAQRCGAVGSDLIVADRLGVAPLTIARRKADASPISKEAWLALAAVEMGLSGVPTKD